MAGDIVSIKGTKDGLVICLAPQHDFELMKSSLQAKIESARGFFNGARFAFNYGGKPLSNQQEKELVEICCEHGLIPAEQITYPAQPAQKHRSMDYEHTIITKGFLPAEEKQRCYLLEQNLRSGQKLSYPGHVTVVGHVNPGAEIVATGNILIMGALNGIAHAGVEGNKDAVIVAYHMKPQQLRIADAVARAPEKINSTSIQPEIARYKGGQIIVKPFGTSKVSRVR